MAGLERREHARGTLRLRALEHVRALMDGQALDDRLQLGVVEAVDAARRRVEGQRVRAPRRGVEVLPADRVARESRRERTQAQAAEDSRQAGLYGDDFDPVARRGKDHVPHSSQSTALEVDDLAVENVAAQQQAVAGRPINGLRTDQRQSAVIPADPDRRPPSPIPPRAHLGGENLSGPGRSVRSQDR